jgi:pimeloyl-ACP methyl ester carboxylesterase
MKREEHLIGEIFAYRYTGAFPDHALLVCHGMGGHGGIYDPFCATYAESHSADVWSIDLPGFGRSTNAGRRGEFTATQWVEATVAVAEHIVEVTGLPVIVKGSSLGVFAASAALLASEQIDAAILMGMAVAGAGALIPGRPAHPFTTEAGQQILREYGRTAVVKIDRLVDFDIDYGFAGAAEEKRRDPLNTWEMDLASFASIFTYAPASRWSDNIKPILFTVGELDPLSPPDRVRFVADHLPCPNEVYVHPQGVHQLMLFHTIEYCAVVRDFVERSLWGTGLNGTHNEHPAATAAHTPPTNEEHP